MATQGQQQQFPPQKQPTQPGKEHVMDPSPQFSSFQYKPSNKLLGKVALVTGGDSGIGRAVSHCFALEGATVAFKYVKKHEERDARDTLQLLRECQAPDAKQPVAVAADLGFDEDCKRVVDDVVAAYGRIDILVNCAAEQHKTNSVEEIDEQRLERVFRTNIFSQFFMVRQLKWLQLSHEYLSSSSLSLSLSLLVFNFSFLAGDVRHALKHMKEGSSIINTTSVIAYEGSPQLLDYSATKGVIVASPEVWLFSWQAEG